MLITVKKHELQLKKSTCDRQSEGRQYMYIRVNWMRLSVAAATQVYRVSDVCDEKQQAGHTASFRWQLHAMLLSRRWRGAGAQVTWRRGLCTCATCYQPRWLCQGVVQSAVHRMSVNKVISGCCSFSLTDNMYTTAARLKHKLTTDDLLRS